jgi:hypothetical protein
MDLSHMKAPTRFLILAAALGTLSGCDRLPTSGSSGTSSNQSSSSSGENIDASEKVTAAKLRPAKDPIQEEIYKAKLETRQAYNNRRFDELETKVAALRTGKETYGNGSWKIAQFYEAFACDDKEPESMWQLHDRIHQEWIAAKPTSIAARIAYADFLTDYAWRARGSGYADSVKEEGWRLFEERLANARKVLMEGRALQEKDPCWWMMAFTVALGQGWDLRSYDALVAEAHAFEPKFWGYDVSRAYSLLPRWHGEEGDWEAFAEKTAARPEGLGAELYARIVIRQRGFYENVFRETKASWPRTKEGLTAMIEKYPESLGILSEAAILATHAQDQATAKAWYAKIGDRYLPSVFRKPERFVHYRHWAETGQW